jgi:hypothetical protein
MMAKSPWFPTVRIGDGSPPVVPAPVLWGRLLHPTTRPAPRSKLCSGLNVFAKAMVALSFFVGVGFDEQRGSGRVPSAPLVPKLNLDSPPS